MRTSDFLHIVEILWIEEPETYLNLPESGAVVFTYAKTPEELSPADLDILARNRCTHNPDYPGLWLIRALDI
jgi:hypothetical protein